VAGEGVDRDDGCLAPDLSRAAPWETWHVSGAGTSIVAALPSAVLGSGLTTRKDQIMQQTLPEALQAVAEAGAGLSKPCR